jgi:hypothetical protein
LLLDVEAFAAPNRSVALGQNFNNTVTDLNEELTEIYQNTPFILDNVAGTNDITASIEGLPTLTAYSHGQVYRIKIVNTNTSGTVNLSIDGLTNTSVVDFTGVSLPVGGLNGGSLYDFIYLGAPDNHFRVLSTLGTGVVTDPLCFALSDETTAITTGTKVTFRMPHAMTVSAVYGELNTASSSGNVVFDIHESGTTILGNKITIDQGEEDSQDAGTLPTIADANIAFRAKMTFDIDSNGSGAKGAKVCMVGSH